MSSDNQRMPFGAHKGKPMGQVPAQYLDWLIDQPWIKKWPEVERYILQNKKVIDQELEDADDE